MAQRKLKTLISPEFYIELEGQFPSTFTANNTALFDPYIKDFLAWDTYYNYLKFSNWDPTPTGLREFNDENSSVLSDVKMFSAEKNIQGESEAYRGEIVNFLRLEQSKDSTKYPLFNYACNNDFGFAITSIDKSSDVLIKVNKSIKNNE